MHSHSYYSYNDGVASPKEYVELCQKYDYPAIGLTDHRNASGWIELLEATEGTNIKPIYGVEINLIDKPDNTENQHHLTIWIKDKIGYYNLLKIIYNSNVKYFYKKPLVPFQDLLENREGLIIGSGCIQSPINFALKKSKDIARKLLDLYKNNFEDFYLEIMPHNMLKEQMFFNEFLINAGQKLKIPLILTLDTHNINNSLELNNILIANKLHITINDLNHKSIETLKFVSPEEAIKRLDKFDKKIITKAIKNTVKLADTIVFDYKKDIDFNNKIPTHYKDGFQILKSRIKNNIKRIKNFNKVYEKRLKKEITVIKDKGYVDYFLLVSDLINWAKENDIATGDARGSVGGSLLAYSLGITSLDPIKYNLIFERFLNKERTVMPDIDLDFDTCKRNKVLKYLSDKYKGVAQIVSKAEYKPKSAFKAVVRAYEGQKAYAKANSISKSLYDDIKDKNKYFNSLMKRVPEWEKYNKLAVELLGKKSNRSVHAAGVLLSPFELAKSVPIRKFNGVIISDYDKNELKKLGFLKLDILGLTAAGHLSEVHKLVEIKTGKKVIEDLGDKKMYLEFIKHSNNIFQFGSPGMTQMVRLIKPKNLSDLALVLALHRPGALSQKTHKKVAVYREKNQVVVPEEIVDICQKSKELRKVFSSLTIPYQFVFQEDVMNFFHKIGFNFSESDLLRRAIEESQTDKQKFERKESLQKIKIKLLEFDKNLSSKDAETVIVFLAERVGYSFNKSHSFGYATIAARQLFYKYYYPLEYFILYLTMYDEYRQKKAIKEARNYGIKVLPPNIQEICSEYYIKDIDQKMIQAPLTIIKHTSKASIRQLINNLVENNLQDVKLDFWKFLKITENINASAIKHILYSNQFNLDVNTLEEMFLKYRDGETISDLKKQYKKISSQKLVDSRAYDPNYFRAGLLKSEKEKMEISLMEISKKFKTARIFEGIDKTVWMPVVVQKYTEIVDKKGNLMAFITIMDLEEKSKSFPIFSSNWNKKVKEILNTNRLILAKIGSGSQGPIIWGIIKLK